jgi:hypothetical protein
MNGIQAPLKKSEPCRPEIQGPAGALDRAIPHHRFSSCVFAWACPLVPLAGR